MIELLSYEDLKNHLLSISDMEHRALLCTIYACMSRESEIVWGRLKKTKPFMVEDIKSYDNRIELFIKSAKGNKPRKTPIFRNREAWLCDIIEGWARLVKTGPLFPISTRTVERIFKKWFPDIKSNRGGNVDGSKHTIHWLRGWRYSHYRRGDVTGKRVESKIASMIGGWASSAVPEKFYDFTRIEDYMDDLENHQED